MDTLAKASRVQRVLRARDNARMRLTLPMKPPEIGMIVSEDSTLIGCSVGKDLRVVNLLIRPPCFLNRQHVMAEAAQLLYNRQRKILVRIEPGHKSQSASLSRMS